MNIAALLAGLFSGILGSMGLGGGAVLIIYLTLFTGAEQLNAQGINLIFFIPIAVVSVIVYAIKKQIVWKKVLILGASGLAGAILGLFTASFLGGEIAAKVFGVLLVIMGLKEIFFGAKKGLAKRKVKWYTKNE